MPVEYIMLDGVLAYSLLPVCTYAHACLVVWLQSQYRLCYKVAQEFQRNRRVYANT